MTKTLNFALKIKGGGREGGTCEVLRPCHPPKFGTCTNRAPPTRKAKVQSGVFFFFFLFRLQRQTVVISNGQLFSSAKQGKTAILLSINRKATAPLSKQGNSRLSFQKILSKNLSERWKEQKKATFVKADIEEKTGATPSPMNEVYLHIKIMGLTHQLAKLIK